jgi:hypothetical protein
MCSDDPRYAKHFCFPVPNSKIRYLILYFNYDIIAWCHWVFSFPSLWCNYIPNWNMIIHMYQCIFGYINQIWKFKKNWAMSQVYNLVTRAGTWTWRNMVIWEKVVHIDESCSRIMIGVCSHWMKLDLLVQLSIIMILHDFKAASSYG